MIGEFAALGAAISWAVAPILYRKALSKTKPVSANIVRSVSNAAVLLFCLLAIGRAGVLTSLPMEVFVLTFASGVIGLGLGDTLYMMSLKSVGVARAVPLASTYPLFSLLWATILLGQSVTVPAVFGALAILFGIWLLSREREQSTPKTQTKFQFKGVTSSLATAIVWSISITLMDAAIHLPGTSSLDVNFAIVTVRLATLSVFMLALSPILDKDRGFLKIKRRTLIQLCTGGLVANGIGWLLMNISFLNIMESQAVPISSTTPLFSTMAGFALFNEKVTVKSALGAIVIVVGIFLIFMI
jgi:DME family drug/metabolite transporter